jgi:hypothetical protein
MTTAAQARRYLRGQRYGIFSTLSQKLGGYRFGSLTPTRSTTRRGPFLD